MLRRRGNDLGGVGGTLKGEGRQERKIKGWPLGTASLRPAGFSFSNPKARTPPLFSFAQQTQEVTIKFILCTPQASKPQSMAITRRSGTPRVEELQAPAFQGPTAFSSSDGSIPGPDASTSNNTSGSNSAPASTKPPSTESSSTNTSRLGNRSLQQNRSNSLTLRC